MSGRHRLNAIRTLPSDLLGLARGLRDDRSGATFTLVGISLSVLIGMAGLGFDATLWYMNKRELQTVADVSVLAGLEAMLNGATDDEAKQAAFDHATRNDFVDGEDGRVVVNIPPTSGPYAGRDDHIEVIAFEDAKLTFSSLFVENAFEIAARSVAGVITVGGNCVLALSPDLDSAVQVGGNAVANINCGVASNSTSNSSLRLHGGGILKASPVQVAGDINISNNATLTEAYPDDPPPATFAPEVPDPHAGLVMPSVSAADCIETDYIPEAGDILVPGVYCGNLSIEVAVDVEPGVYIIYNGDLSFTDQAEVDAQDVSFLFTGSTPASIGGLRNINGGATVSLSAPTSDGHAEGDYAGEYGGMLFFQDDQALSYSAADGSTLLMNQINGGASVSLNGSAYFPQQELRMNGNTDFADGCFQIVAFKVTFLGTTNIENDPDTCTTYGVETDQQLRARLRE